MSGNKWCEWCCASVEMNSTICNYCESESFLHSKPLKEPIDPWEAREKREKREYEKVSPIIHKMEKSKNDLGEDIRNKVKVEQPRPIVSREEQELDKEIADLVVQIEITNRKLQELLARKSPEIQKLDEVKIPKVQTQTVTTKVTEVGISSGFLDAVSELFDN